jgi:peptidoglycan/LPS O-acetylase OafA/YrhL
VLTGPLTQVREPVARPAHASPPSFPRPRQSSLTGLRGLAALLVIGTHAAFATGKLTPDYLGALYGRLEIGVPIFFALSGFLLFEPWVRAAATDSAPPSVRRYTWQRVRRIMPAYVITVLLVYSLYTVFQPGPNPGQTWAGLVRHLTLTQIYTDNFLLTYLHPGLSQMWSLAVEFSFYAVLPLLAHVLLTVISGRRWRPGVVLLGLAALAAIGPLWVMVVRDTDWLPNSAGMWLPAQIGAFAGGMALAVLARNRFRLRPTAPLIVAVVAYLAAASPAGDDAPTRTVLYAVIAVSVLAPLTLGDRGWWSELLSSRLMVWIGGISYEIFLVHVAVMAVSMNLILRWPLFTGSMIGLAAVTLAATVPLARLLHRVTAASTEPVQVPTVPASAAMVSNLR